eukprot:Gb_18048 [translate_table: standard]
MKFESDKLRINLYEKYQTILSVRKEMEVALASLKEAELDMNRTLDEKEEFRKVEEEGRYKIKMLTTELKHSQVECQKRSRNTRLNWELSSVSSKICEGKMKNYSFSLSTLAARLKGSKRNFESDKKRESLAGQLEALKVEVVDLRREKETLSKGMVDKVYKMASLHQEIDGNIQGLIVAKEEMLKRYEEIESLYRQLEGASNSMLCLEQEGKELREKLITLEMSWFTFQSKVEEK